MPQLSDLYQLLDTHYDAVKAQWEDRFEKAYGYWRGFVDNVVLRYFDCGVPEGGFAPGRLRGLSERILTVLLSFRGI